MSPAVARSVNRLKVTRTVAEDVEELARTMREEDREEAWHSTRLSPLEALQESVEASNALCMTVRAPEGVVCIFGLTARPQGHGIPWLLASDLLGKYPKSLVRQGRKWVEEMLQITPFLYNMAWVPNASHLKLIKHLGFTFGELRYHNRQLFQLFYRSA